MSLSRIGGVLFVGALLLGSAGCPLGDVDVVLSWDDDANLNLGLTLPDETWIAAPNPLSDDESPDHTTENCVHSGEVEGGPQSVEHIVCGEMAGEWTAVVDGEPGTFKLEILLDGAHVGGSPYVDQVLQGTASEPDFGTMEFDFTL